MTDKEVDDNVDDSKRRFKEALDRKNAQHEDHATGREDPAAKIHGAHGPEGNKRMFRRKSGG